MKRKHYQNISFIRLNWFLEDTKLMDVKLCDLRSWLSRRDKSFGGIANAVVKSFYRFEHYYFDHYLINLVRFLHFQLFRIYTVLTGF